MSARNNWDRRTLQWLSLWVVARKAASGSVSLVLQDHHGTYQQPREIRSHRQSWTTTKALILARSGMAGRAASCQPYSAEMKCRRIRFETCHCRRRASIMPRAFWTIEIMNYESTPRPLRNIDDWVLRKPLGSTLSCCSIRRHFALEYCHLTTAWRKIEDARSPPRAHVGIPARKRDSWPMQCNFDLTRCGDWLLTLDFFGKREPMKAVTAKDTESWV